MQGTTVGISMKRVVLLVSLVFLFFSEFRPARAVNEEKIAENHFNVVIVADASYSMTRSDPDKLRFEAIQQFTDLLTVSGNKLGSVVFSTDILSVHELVPVNEYATKKEIVNSIKNVDPTNDTDIGEALLKAIDMLKSDGDPNIESCILLLSDGNTDLMPDKEAHEKSLEDKADAIQEAKDNNIKIHTICLNVDHSADITEMEQISNATGGFSEEVGKAEDLKEVFNALYGMIYGTSAIVLIDDAFSDEGVIRKEER